MERKEATRKKKRKEEKQISKKIKEEGMERRQKEEKPRHPTKEKLDPGNNGKGHVLKGTAPGFY